MQMFLEPDWDASLFAIVRYPQARVIEPAFAALWRKERGQYAIKPQIIACRTKLLRVLS
jgi:hypothetical protein